MKQLPLDFENRMKNLLGDEFESYKASLEEEPVKSFRVKKLLPFKFIYNRLLLHPVVILFNGYKISLLP